MTSTASTNSPILTTPTCLEDILETQRELPSASCSSFRDNDWSRFAVKHYLEPAQARRRSLISTTASIQSPSARTTPTQDSCQDVCTDTIEPTATTISFFDSHTASDTPAVATKVQQISARSRNPHTPQPRVGQDPSNPHPLGYVLTCAQDPGS